MDQNSVSFLFDNELNQDAFQYPCHFISSSSCQIITSSDATATLYSALTLHLPASHWAQDKWAMHFF